MNTKKLSLLALFIALSIIGAMIKIPAVIGSVALDIFPALVVAVLVGRKSGAVVAGMGHIVSALIGGLPMGPLHLLVAIEMAFIVLLFGYLYQSGKKILASSSFVLLNGLVAPLPFAFVLSVPFYVTIVPSLLIGAALNTVLAVIFIPRVEPFFRTKLAGILNE